MPRAGILFGYFFGTRFEAVPEASEFARLSAGEAVWVVEFSYLGLRNGSLKLVRCTWPWNKEPWPFPSFSHRDPITGRYWRRRLDETDLATTLSQEPISEEEAIKLPEDGLAGAVFVEKRLSRLLGISN